MRTKILIYDDAPNLGGHELMTLQLLEQLVDDGRYEITFVASRSNHGLCQLLACMAPAIRVRLTPYASGRGQWLMTYLSVRALWQLWRVLRLERPKLLLVAQGGIAISSLALLAGRLAGVRTISYIPMTHDESVFTASTVRARLRQWFARPLYSLPECLITISPRMAGYAARRRRGAVRVVENGVRLPQVRIESRAAVRSALGLHDGEQLLLMLGRIEFWQKRHDLAVQALAIARSRGVRMHMLVVGSGPDEQALRTLVEEMALGDVVHWLGWQADVTSFYAACDVLLLPSRYEGVPLVMLEAMYAGRRIAAANIDGMADMLPPTWTFASGDAGAMADLLCTPDTEADADHLLRHRELISKRYTVEAFGRRFIQVIDEELALARA